MCNVAALHDMGALWTMKLFRTTAPDQTLQARCTPRIARCPLRSESDRNCCVAHEVRQLYRINSSSTEPAEPAHLASVGLVRLDHVEERVEDLLSPPVRVGPHAVVERAPEQLGQPPQSRSPVVALVAVLWHGPRLRARARRVKISEPSRLRRRGQADHGRCGAIGDRARRGHRDSKQRGQPEVRRSVIDVRFAPKATELLLAAKCREGPCSDRALLGHCNATSIQTHR
jgi:hypothetical protein